MESIHSVAATIDRHDTFDDFAKYIASTLRQMPPNFCRQSVGRDIYSFHAELRLRCARLATAPIVTFANVDGVIINYYLFGEREEQYDAIIHREMHVTDYAGMLVTDTYILSEIERAGRQPPTSVRSQHVGSDILQ